MNTVFSRIESDFFQLIPPRPGVYFFLGHNKELLYVGKANDLRKRIAHYRTPHDIRDPRASQVASEATSIRWEQAKDETEALLREAELIQAFLPRLNRAHTRPIEYLYIGVRGLKSEPGLQFELSANPNGGSATYGCFPHLGKGRHTYPAVWMKAGYLGLLRALFALEHDKPALRFPKSVTARSVPQMHRGPLSVDWHGPLHRLLTGQSPVLLEHARSSIEVNPSIPEFMKPALRRDIEAAATFYRVGPKRLRDFRRRHGLKAGPVSMQVLNDLLKEELQSVIGDFTVKKQVAKRSGPSG